MFFGFSSQGCHLMWSSSNKLATLSKIVLISSLDLFADSDIFIDTNVPNL